MFDLDDYQEKLLKAVEEIDAALVEPQREEGEVTVREYAEKKGMTVSGARRKLDRGTEKGHLRKRIIKQGRVFVAVYKVIE